MPRALGFASTPNSLSSPSSRHAPWLFILLIWLAGNGLRITLLAVPPVLTLIRDEFGLSATEVGLLGSIPQLLLALAALGGALLVARLGLRGALAAGLLIIAAGSALRGLSGSYGTLLATTVVMSAGIAMLQPIMATAVRLWMPERIGLGTAIYTNGLLVGEVLPTLLTIPVVLPLLNDSWRGSLVLWSVPVLAIAIVIRVWAPRPPMSSSHSAAAPRKWLPDWRSPLLWRLGALFCCINATYFAANAFIPIYLASRDRTDLIGPALLALNLGQIPGSLLLLAVARRVERRAWPYHVACVLWLAGLAGVVFDVGSATIWWSALLGAPVAAALIFSLALPPLLAKPEDVARLSAGVFTLSYGAAVGVALLCGAAWDVSGIPALAFAPLALCAFVLMGLVVAMRRRGELL